MLVPTFVRLPAPVICPLTVMGVPDVPIVAPGAADRLMLPAHSDGPVSAPKMGGRPPSKMPSGSTSPFNAPTPVPPVLSVPATVRGTPVPTIESESWMPAAPVTARVAPFLTVVPRTESPSANAFVTRSVP